MPILESTSNITPRSAVRYRPMHTKSGQNNSSTKNSAQTSQTPVIQRASRPRPRIADALEIDEWQRDVSDELSDEIPSQPVVRRTNLPKTPRPQGNDTTASMKAANPKKKPARRFHPLLFLGIGMVVMLSLWFLISSAISWINLTLDDIHYGRPRTFQIDAVVGHNDSASSPSHFIAINLHGHIEIIELPGGDASHARIYMGPQLYGTGNDLVPVTLRFVDVNGDHLPDMIIRFQGSQVVLINDQGGFRPLKPEEQQQVAQFLQHLAP